VLVAAMVCAWTDVLRMSGLAERLSPATAQVLSLRRWSSDFTRLSVGDWGPRAWIGSFWDVTVQTGRQTWSQHFPGDFRGFIASFELKNRIVLRLSIRACAVSTDLAPAEGVAGGAGSVPGIESGGTVNSSMNRPISGGFGSVILSALWLAARLRIRGSTT